MGLYDSYQLSNSRLAPQYAGSTLPERVKVMDALQQRYDNARFSDDMLQRTANDAKISESDRGLYNEVVNNYSTRMKDRAVKGNYEDMMMDTARDAYDFASDYKPFAENYGRIQGNLAEIQKQEAENKIGTGTAAKLRQEMQYYGGLKKDSATGKYTNFYQGTGIAKDVDVSKKVEDWAKDVVARETGQEVKQMSMVNGELHYVTAGGTSSVVTAAQLRKAVESGSRLDPEFKDYVAQKKRLDTLGYDKVTYDSYAQNDPKGADNIKALADKNGVSFGQALRSRAGQAIEQQLMNDAMNYAGKFVQNNRTSKWLDGGETEDVTRAKNKADKEENNIFAQMNIPAYGYDFNTPDKIANEVQASRGRANVVSQQYQSWANGHNDYGQKVVAKKVNGEDHYFTADGKTDVTYDALRFRQQKQIEDAHNATLSRIDAEAQREAGYKMSPDLRNKANQAYQDELIKLTNSNAHLSGALTDANIKEAANRAKMAVMGDSPGYKKYQEILDQKAKAMTMSTNVARFTKEEDNKRIEALAQGLTNSDFQQSLVGAWGVGTTSLGKQLEPDDYEKMKGTIKFAGMHLDAAGEQQAIFSAENPKSKEQFQFALKGFTTKQPLPKLLGIDAKAFYLNQAVRSALNNPEKTADIELPNSNGTKVKIAVNDGTREGSKYHIILQSKDGRAKSYGADDENQLLNTMNKLFQ